MNRILIDTQRICPVEIDNSISSFDELKKNLLKDMENRNLESRKFSIKNRRLKFKQKRGKYIYHVLQQPAGIRNLYCKDETHKKERKCLEFDMVYTVMILKMMERGGKYHIMAERIVHTLEPIKHNLKNKVYHWYFSNVYEAGNICWGEAARTGLPEVDDNTSYIILDKFFNDTKNNDLFSEVYKNRSWNKYQEGKIYQMNSKDLIPYRQKYTVKELLDSF